MRNYGSELLSYIPFDGILPFSTYLRKKKFPEKKVFQVLGFPYPNIIKDYESLTTTRVVFLDQKSDNSERDTNIGHNINCV